MNTRFILGTTIRKFRERQGLSQEKLAEKANITYQYLSSLENGRENFTIGVLEKLAGALRQTFPDLVAASFSRDQSADELSRINPNYIRRKVPLPVGLSHDDVAIALDETQRIVRLLNMSLVRVGSRPLSSYIQANNFSGIVSNILSDSFDRLTVYKHNSNQQFPDLIFKEAYGNRFEGLEIKSTIRVGKGGESHNGHSGWHLVVCFKLDKSNGDISFIHAMCAELVGYTEKYSDWKYVGSKVNEKGSQRTETYVTTGIGTTKLRDGSVYLDSDAISIKRWRPQHVGLIPTYSIFHK